MPPATMPAAGRAQTAGAQASIRSYMQAGGGGGGDVTRIHAAGAGAQVQPAFDAGMTLASGAGADDASMPAPDSGAAMNPREQDVGPHDADAAALDAAPPRDAASAADAAPAQDAGVVADAAQAGSGGDGDRDDHLVREALREALLQLLLDLGNSAALGPELAGLIALIVADGALSPQLLAAALDFIADSNACHQDAESENACAAMCAGLAVQCKSCADDRACRNALQRVCGGQVRVDRCR